MKPPSPPAIHERIARHWRWIRFLLLATAIANGWIQHFYIPDDSSDILFYVGAGLSLLRGQGSGLSIAPFNDLSQSVFKHSVVWPEGLPLALAGVMHVVADATKAVLYLDWFWIAACFVAWFIILERSGMAWTTRACVWLLWAFVFFPFRYAGTADLQAAALYSGAVAICLTMIGRNRPAIGLAFVAGLLVGGACLTRYAYWPLVPVLPVAYAMSTWRNSRQSKVEVAVLAATSLAALGAIAIWHHVLVGHATFRTIYHPMGRGLGFSLENVMRFYPFAANAFGLNDVGKVFGYTHRTLWFYVGLKVVTLLLMGFYYHGTIREAARTFFCAPLILSDKKKSFINASSLLTVTGTLITLGYMSLRDPRDPWGIGLEIPRYYLPIIGFLTLYFAQAAARLQARRTAGGKSWKTVALSFVAATTVVLVLAGGWSSFRENLRPHGPYRNLKFRQHLLEAVQDVRRDDPVVFIDNHRRSQNYEKFLAASVGLTEAIPNNNTASMATTRPVRVILREPTDPKNDTLPRLRALAVQKEAQRIAWKGEGELMTFILPAGTYALK